VCHCFAEAVRGVTGWPDTACAKQWHTVVRNADYWFSEQGIATIQYTETDHYKTTKAFMDNPRRMLHELMKE